MNRLRLIKSIDFGRERKRERDYSKPIEGERTSRIMDANSEGWKEISLRYGDIIAVKMSGSNYFLGSNG